VGVGLGVGVPLGSTGVPHGGHVAVGAPLDGVGLAEGVGVAVGETGQPVAGSLGEGLDGVAVAPVAVALAVAVAVALAVGVAVEVAVALAVAVAVGWPVALADGVDVCRVGDGLAVARAVEWWPDPADVVERVLVRPVAWVGVASAAATEAAVDDEKACSASALSWGLRETPVTVAPSSSPSRA
jgi:hypothetical protein